MSTSKCTNQYVWIMVNKDVKKGYGKPIFIWKEVILKTDISSDYIKEYDTMGKKNPHSRDISS